MPSKNNKRIAKNTLMLYVRLFFSMGVSLYASRLVLNTLGIVDFGINNIVGGVISMMSFFIISLAIITERYVSIELAKENEGNVSQIFSMALLIHLLVGIIIIILAETIGLWFFFNKIVVPSDRYNAAFWVYQLSIINCFIGVFTAPYMGSIIAHERMNLFAYISIIDAILKLVVVLTLSYIAFDKLITYSIFNLIAAIIILSTYILVNTKCFPKLKFHFYWNSYLFKEIVGMTIWNLIDNFSNIWYTQGINVMLNIFFGPSINAVRGIASQVQTGINGFSGNLQTAFNPQIAKSYIKNEINVYIDLIINSSRISLMVLIIFSLPIFLETGTILKIWLGVIPDHLINFVRIILLITIVESLSRPITMGVLATGRIKKYEIFSNLSLLMILPIAFIILKFSKIPEYALIVTFCILVITLFVRLYLLNKIVNFQISVYCKDVLLKSIKYIVPSILTCLIPYYLMPQTYIRCFIVCIVSTIASFTFIYCFGLKQSEKNYLKNKIKLSLKNK